MAHSVTILIVYVAGSSVLILHVTCFITEYTQQQGPWSRKPCRPEVPEQGGASIWGGDTHKFITVEGADFSMKKIRQ